MPELGLKDGAFPEITEIWRIGPNQLIVWVHPEGEDARRVRITALENVRSGATSRYFAGYDIVTTVRDSNGVEQETWVAADYPWQDGETPEECLRAALMWVANPH